MAKLIEGIEYGASSVDGDGDGHGRETTDGGKKRRQCGYGIFLFSGTRGVSRSSELRCRLTHSVGIDPSISHLQSQLLMGHFNRISHKGAIKISNSS